MGKNLRGCLKNPTVIIFPFFYSRAVKLSNLFGLNPLLRGAGVCKNPALKHTPLSPLRRGIKELDSSAFCKKWEQTFQTRSQGFERRCGNLIPIPH